VRTLSPRSIAVTDQILAILAEESPLPVPTGVLWRKLSPMPATVRERCEAIDSGRVVLYSETLRLLNLLARRGEIEKWPASEDRRSCLWRRLTIPEEISNG
jgi:hypothetical protein